MKGFGGVRGGEGGWRGEGGEVDGEEEERGMAIELEMIDGGGSWVGTEEEMEWWFVGE